MNIIIIFMTKAFVDFSPFSVFYFLLLLLEVAATYIHGCAPAVRECDDIIAALKNGSHIATS